MADGDALDDRYVRKRILGEGGAGRVWLVEDRLRAGQALALKELAPAGRAQHEAAFRREFATLACLRHPNLVEVDEFDAAPDNGVPRFTLEFIEGRDIVEAVRHEGPGLLPGLVAEALRALAFLHDFGMIHRDLKPANLLVRDAPKLGCRLVVVDFGLAQASDALAADDDRPGGTLPYLAPELFANLAASRRSDLYALGAVVHEIVYGAPPHPVTATASGEFVRDVVEAPPAPPAIPAGYPPGLREWLVELLSPDPERRPETAGQALARLNVLCGTDFPSETPATRTARLLSGPPAERLPSLRALWRALDRAEGARVVFLCGGPGSGKSRILRWLEAEAIQRGWRVESVAARLRGAPANPSTLVLVDEANAAPAGVVDFLLRIAREPGATPLRAVVALRSGAVESPDLRALVAAAGTVPTVVRVDLSPLEADGVRAMACRAAGTAVSDERVAWLLEASGGSPATVEALLVDGAWERGGRIRPDATGPSIARGRLDLISPPARAWLDAVAVLRRHVRDADAAALSGLSPDAVRGAAEEVAAAGLVHRKQGRWSADSTALVEALLAAMPPERRQRLSRQAAERLDGGDDADKDLALVATLWAGAGEPARAADRFVGAARGREVANDPAGAAARYADALRLTGRAAPERAGLRRRQAEALLRAGMYAAAARAAGAGVRLARSDGERADAFALQAFALVQAGRFRLALEAAARAASLARDAARPAALARARRAEGIGLGRLGRERDAIAVLEEARALFRELGDARGEADALHAMATCRTRLRDDGAETDLLDAIELYRRAAAENGTQPPDAQDLKARVGLAVIRARSGRLEESSEILEDVKREAAARGNRALQEVALSKLAQNAIDRGQLDRAIALAEQAADLALHLGDHNLILVNACAVADARIRCGRAGAAATALRAALDAPLANVEPEIVDYARMLLANAWMESAGADDGEIRGLLERSLDGCRSRGKRRARLMALVIEMERRARAGGPDPFEPVRSEYDAVARQAGEPVEPEIRIRAGLAGAAFHLAHARADDARALAQDAVDTARAAGALAFEARATAQLAVALERAGRDAEAAAAAARGRTLLARAADRIEDPSIRADFLARSVYAPLRAVDSPQARKSEARLAALYDMIRVLNSETDAEALLETILDLALAAVAAERGMVFLREDREGPGHGAFSVHVSRELETETLRDAEGFSRRIVEAAGAGRSILAVDAGADERFRDLASVSLYRIRSLMCVPLRSRGRVIGTVYLDSRRDGRLFTQDDLRFVEAFADQAALAIENTRMRVRLERENRQLAAAAEARTSFANLVGRSPGIQAVFSLIEKVAGTDLPVLIRGESGTGKELVARAIHVHGPRRRRPFLGENCAAIPESLLESTLFGHVRGAFTGADRDRPGLFEQAHGGTLFLDEVGDMSPAMQVRLLRVVEDGVVRRVGGEKPIPVDVRLVTATHRDLGAEIKAGRFRQDLLYRLQVLTIEIPPLRERPGDVALLASHFLERIGSERGRPPATIDDEAMALLTRYGWPGNVRELQNTLQRLTLLAGNRAIGAALIESDPILRKTLIPEREQARATLTLKSGEKEQIRQAIAAAGGNRRNAAKLLGVSRATLYRKLERHGL